MDNEKILNELEKVTTHNKIEVSKVGGDQNFAKNIVTLPHEEYGIYDPFVDESGRFEVNPIEYYGLEKVLKMIEEFNKLKI